MCQDKLKSADLTFEIPQRHYTSNMGLRPAACIMWPAATFLYCLCTLNISRMFRHSAAPLTVVVPRAAGNKLTLTAVGLGHEKDGHPFLRQITERTSTGAHTPWTDPMVHTPCTDPMVQTPMVHTPHVQTPWYTQPMYRPHGTQPM
jgi:hypothetical protein